MRYSTARIHALHLIGPVLWGLPTRCDTPGVVIKKNVFPKKEKKKTCMFIYIYISGELRVLFFFLKKAIPLQQWDGWCFEWLELGSLVLEVSRWLPPLCHSRKWLSWVAVGLYAASADCLLLGRCRGSYRVAVGRFPPVTFFSWPKIFCQHRFAHFKFGRNFICWRWVLWRINEFQASPHFPPQKNFRLRSSGGFVRCSVGG